MRVKTGLSAPGDGSKRKRRAQQPEPKQPTPGPAGQFEGQRVQFLCVSDAPTLPRCHAPFPASSSHHRRRPTDGRDRCAWRCAPVAGPAGPAARKIMSARGSSPAQGPRAQARGCPVRPSTDPRGFIPDEASHHRHCNPCPASIHCSVCIFYRDPARDVPYFPA